MDMKKLFTAFAVLVICFLGSYAANADDDYIKYDFSKPDEVFKATAKESAVGLGVDPSILYKLTRAGQFVIVNDEPNNPKIPWLTTEGILVNAPPEVVFGVIEKIEDYPKFMPQTGNASRKALTESIDQIFYELEIQVLFIKIKVPYSVYHWNHPPHRVDWVLASGDFNQNIGAYEVVPVPGEPNRCMLFYSSYALPRNSTVVSLFNKIPSLDLMINLSAGTLIVEAMKKQSEEIFSKKGGDVTPPAGKVDFNNIIKEHPEDLAKLAVRGKMVLLEDVDPMYYSGVVVMDKPKNEVFDSVSDFEGSSSISKNSFMKVLEKADNSARVEVRTVINLVVDFDSTYIANYKLSKPDRMDYTQEPGGDLEGVAGSWIYSDLPDGKTLAVYRNTSDLLSTGFSMRQIVKIEPSFEQAIQASQTIIAISNIKRWTEASPAERKEMAKDPQ